MKWEAIVVMVILIATGMWLVYEPRPDAADGATLVPLGQLFERLDELDPQAETVVYCRSGSRSAMAVKYLQSHHFVRAVNLRGGINDWAARIDPGMQRY